MCRKGADFFAGRKKMQKNWQVPDSFLCAFFSSEMGQEAKESKEMKEEMPKTVGL